MHRTSGVRVPLLCHHQLRMRAMETLRTRSLPYTLILIVFLITHYSGLVDVRAQNACATLSGSVRDQNGALDPGVNIAVINVNQGFQRSTTTNDDGNFIVPLLPPNTYSVK